MTRERQVYPTSEIPHKWAHQTQAEARNAQGNLYFKGATIYSYRDSWPLARIHSKRDGEKLVLTNSGRCSTTTAQHQYAVNSACSHMAPIAVPFCSNERFSGRTQSADHGDNLKYLQKTAADYLSKAQRVMSACAVTWQQGHAQTLHKQLAQYLKFFGIRRKAPVFPAAAWAAALERATRIETPDPVRDARKIKQREQRQAQKRAELQSMFDAYCGLVAAYNAAFDAALAALPAVDAAQVWRDTGKWPHLNLTVAMDRPYEHYKQRAQYTRAGFTVPEVKSLAHGGRMDCLLRVNGDEIETSRGARIPLDHAPRLWRFIQAIKAAGIPYAHAGHTNYAGEFKIDSIDAAGNLKAGCHMLEYAELRRLAVTLGLEKE